MADRDPTALIRQLRDALDTCKSTLESNNPAIVDTIWIGPIETLVDRIDDALGAANAFLENPAQEPKRMRSAEDWVPELSNYQGDTIGHKIAHRLEVGLVSQKCNVT